MFGHQNDVITQDQHADASVPLPESTINALTNAPATSSETDSPGGPAASAPAIDSTASDTPATATPQVVAPTQPVQPSIDGFIAPSSQQVSSTSPFVTPAPAEPTAYSPVSSQVSQDTPTPASSNDPIADIASEAPASEPTTEPSVAPVTPISPDDLLKIKQEALQSLSPLVGKLDVGPEEKFRTLMMLIQASDDHNKLTEAYEVAKTITNEKARAQALLDVVNEINYFTSKTK